MKTQLIRTGCVLLLLLLAGCSSFSAVTVESPAEMLLLQPAQGPSPVLLTQRVTLSSWGQQKQFIAIGRFTYEQAKLVALLPTGQQLLYLEFDGEQLEQRMVPSIELPGKDILALIQFALWPSDALQNNYRSEQGWKIDITDGRRQLTHNDNLWLDVRYEGQQINIYNYLAKYRVLIETLEQKDLLL
ncbi:MAG: DUF3261 domain-containing protein [Amphritea sp.]|nr:DUF3261 domain-containing protein [Amphritea sp.]MBQ0785116.1 DUF3261 domain-containing protein [Amphritea sp.]